MLDDVFHDGTGNERFASTCRGSQDHLARHALRRVRYRSQNLGRRPQLERLQRQLPQPMRTTVEAVESEDYRDELPAELNAAEFVGPYLFPNNNRRGKFPACESR